MEKPEIILNLWYVCDKAGVIYSLRARAYLGTGTDEEKLAFLKQFAGTDYLIARTFPIPADFYVDGKEVTHKAALEFPGASMALFAQAFETLQNELPSPTPYEIPEQPLVCLTPLVMDDKGDLRPQIAEQKFL
jgi:hypothetical protein